MGSPSKSLSTTPDLFSTASERATSLEPANKPTAPSPKNKTAVSASTRHVLPTNLPSALSHLDDDQLDRLLAAVIAERQARGGKKLPIADVPSRKKRVDAVAIPLTTSKLNAIRAAFKAGVTPSRIVKQFGVSLSDVRKVLAGDGKK